MKNFIKYFLLNIFFLLNINNFYYSDEKLLDNAIVKNGNESTIKLSLTQEPLQNTNPDNNNIYFYLGGAIVFLGFVGFGIYLYKKYSESGTKNPAIENNDESIYIAEIPLTYIKIDHLLIAKKEKKFSKYQYKTIEESLSEIVHNIKTPENSKLSLNIDESENLIISLPDILQILINNQFIDAIEEVINDDIKLIQSNITMEKSINKSYQFNNQKLNKYYMDNMITIRNSTAYKNQYCITICSQNDQKKLLSISVDDQSQSIELEYKLDEFNSINIEFEKHKFNHLNFFNTQSNTDFTFFYNTNFYKQLNNHLTIGDYKITNKEFDKNFIDYTAKLYKILQPLLLKNYTITEK